MTKVNAALRIALLSCFIAYSVADADVALQVTADNVNLRAIADGESEVLSQVSRGTILHADTFDGGDWIGVSVPDGVAVWVYSELVRDDVVAVSKLSVRSGPGINYRTVGMLLKGTKVVSHGVLNGWLKISAPASCRVWISSKYVELASTADKKEVPAPIAIQSARPIKKSVVNPSVKVEKELPEVLPALPVVPIKKVVEEKPVVKVVPPPVKKTVVKPEVIQQPARPIKKSVVNPSVKVEKELPEVLPALPVVPIKKVVEEKQKPVVKVVPPPVKKTVVNPEVIQPVKPVKKVEVNPPVKVEEALPEVLPALPVIPVKKVVEAKPVKIVPVVSDAASISEVIPTPEMTITAVFSGDESTGTSTDDIVTSNVTEVIITEPVVVEAEADKSVIKEPVPVIMFAESDGDGMETEEVDTVQAVIEPETNAIEEAVVVAGMVEPIQDMNVAVVTEISDVEKIFNTNDVARGIDSLDLISAMEQGSGVVLNGRLKRSAVKRKPSEYRLVNIGGKRGSAATCYVISDNNSLDEFVDSIIKVQGKAYWVKGVRQMVVLSDDIKKISVVPVLR